MCRFRLAATVAMAISNAQHLFRRVGCYTEWSGANPPPNGGKQRGKCTSLKLFRITAVEALHCMAKGGKREGAPCEALHGPSSCFSP